MTEEDIKDEAIRLLGPNMQVVHALRKKGYHVYDWETGAKIAIRFVCGSTISPIEVELDLKLIGGAAGLTLESWSVSREPVHPDGTNSRACGPDNWCEALYDE